MTANVKSPKVVAGVLTGLLLTTLAGLMMEYNTNTDLLGSLKSEKLRNEAMLSEKLQLEKDMMKFRQQIESLVGSNAELDKTLQATSKKLSTQESDLKKLKNENSSLRQIKKQHDELKSLQKSLNDEVQKLNGTIAQLQREKLDLNNTVAALEEKNRILASDLNKAQLAFLDYSRIEATKRNEKLTVNARRTKQLHVNFDVPTSMTNISFRITDPKGELISPEHGTIAMCTLDNPENLVASAGKSVTAGNTLKMVEMSFHAKKKLQAGTYKVEVLSENLHVASLQIKLK